MIKQDTTKTSNISVRSEKTNNLLTSCRTALETAQQLENQARECAVKSVMHEGQLDNSMAIANQFSLHGYAWLATYIAALHQLLKWAERLETVGILGELEELILRSGFGEYLGQISGGITMSQVETVRLSDLGIDEEAEHAFRTTEVTRLIRDGNNPQTRQAIANLIVDGHFGALGLEDVDLQLIRNQFQKFSNERIAPFAQSWHKADSLIPDEVIAEMAELGVFGLTVPQKWGGSESGKTAMCLVTEELCRGYLGVGSLATRTEIAADLIREHGTESQKQRWLSGLAKGEVLPTAMFTEPDVGSDLASVSTRASRSGDVYKINGSKTWSTHAARADLMTMLVRTDPDQPGHRGLSMLLAPKPRGTDAEPFPAPGMRGTEIKVLGYRGMKEYEIGFDDFEVPDDCLLGKIEGQGFKQLMSGMETARIQTAARSIGVAQNALELGLNYASERQQFGRSIYDFPRISGKLAFMTVEIMMARQLTWAAAREKDGGRRCDLEAGMAKLLAARVAWSSADNAMQIHGGNGYAEEYPISRVLLDSRILSVFEGTGEIQAEIIARRLLESNRAPAR
mgnify:FL=1